MTNPPPPHDANPQGTGILVLGVPGAERDLLLTALGLAGAALPKDLEGGEWEPARALGDRLLMAAGIGADAWTPLAPEWLTAMEAAGLLEDAPALLTSTFGQASLLAFAEPHAGRLAPVWGRALRRAGLRPAAVLVLEDPESAVAGEGAPPEEAQLLWLRRVLDSEAATRGVPRAVTTAGRLRRDGEGEAGRITQELGLGATPGETLPRAPRPAPEDAEPGALRPPAAVREAWAILAAWTEGGEEGHARLDALRAELDAAARLAGPVVARLRARGGAEGTAAPGEEQAALLRQRDADLARQTDEIARLTGLLLLAEARGLRPRERLRALREAAGAGDAPLRRLGALARGAVAGGLAERWRVRRRMEEVRRAGLLDAEWYLRANLDVALAGMDPLRHYVTHGEAEGRPPNGRGVTASPRPGG